MELNNLLICLDLSPVDDSLIERGVLIAQKTKAVKHVTLLHNIRYDFLKGNIQLSPTELDKLKGKIEHVFLKKYKAQLDQVNISFTVVVKDDNNTEKAILEEISNQQTNLILMGLKRQEDGTGNIPLKILHNDDKQTPLLLVPKNSHPQFNHFLGGIDLTESSTHIIEVTYELTQLTRGVATCLYVYKIPQAYFPYIESPNQQINEQVQKKANRKFQSFVSDLPQVFESNSLNFKAHKSHKIADSILDYAASKQVNLIIIRRRSKTKRTGNLGGVTRRLLHKKSKQTLLVL